MGVALHSKPAVVQENGYNPANTSIGNIASAVSTKVGGDHASPKVFARCLCGGYVDTSIGIVAATEFVGGAS